MEPVVAIVESRSAAAHAAGELRNAGFDDARVQLLLPVDAKGGAATGASAGLGLGAITASFLIPGIGAVVAVGVEAAALLGVAGAAGGAASGAAPETGTDRLPLPDAELYLYEHALARGRGVLFVLVDSENEARLARRALDAAGAENLDAARRSWWGGVEDLRQEVRRGSGAESPEPAETSYRRGFLAALRPGFADKPYKAAIARLEKRNGPAALDPAFRRGYERGRDVARRRLSELSKPPGHADEA